MYYTVIKHSGHLRTLEECRKHSPAARVFYISLVFSNARRVLSQCNTRLRFLYLLNDATFYASATTLTDVQLQLQRDLNSTAIWTKEHGMVAHPEKTKYMIIGTRKKLSRCEECALTLFLDDRKLEQAQEERLLGLNIDKEETFKASCCSGPH